MTEERQPERAESSATEHAEAKSDEEREHEEKWSQGGQDVEEAQHSEPEPGQ